VGYEYGPPIRGRYLPLYARTRGRTTLTKPAVLFVVLAF
jgi:hypothetical protein